MLSYIRRTRLALKRYQKNREGATAIEFAMLIVPFCMLLFAVLELGIIFFLSASLNHALSEVSREIRTGEFQSSCKTTANFKSSICTEMSSGSSCAANLRVDVKTTLSGNFEPNMLPDIPSPPAPGDDPSAPPPVEPDNFDTTSARSPVVVRAQYYYRLALPAEFTRLANTRGNTRIIEAVTAFRNEPFPSGCGS